MKRISYFIFSMALAAVFVQCGGGQNSGENSSPQDSVAAAPAAKPLFPVKPGIQTYSFRASFAVEVGPTLDTIRDMGFTEVEASLDPYGLTTEEFKAMLDERGIKAVSVGVGYEDIVKDPEEIARKTKLLGASYVMVAWIPHKGDDFTIDDAKKAVEDFNRVGKVLKDNGITFTYHTHGYEFRPYEDGTLFDYIVQNTDPANVSFEMDILWVYFPGVDPAALLRKYPDRWKLMHLKDLKKGVVGDQSGHTAVENDVALGTGQINLPEVLKAAQEVGVEYYFIEDESPSVTQQVPKTLEYLKNLTE